VKTPRAGGDAAEPTERYGGRVRVSLLVLGVGVILASVLLFVRASAHGNPSEPPRLRASSLRGGAVLSGTRRWRVSVTGDVRRVVFRVNGRRVGADASAPFGTALRTLQLRDGRHRLSVVLVAASGTPRRVLSRVGRITVANGVVNLRALPSEGRLTTLTSLECPDPQRQLRVDPDVRRGPRPSVRFEVRPGDVWAPNGTLRCLAADYDSGERAGDDYYYAFSLYAPREADNDGYLVWELHHGEPLYRYRACGVAPYALFFHRDDAGREGLYLRLAGGDCNPQRGWTLWHPAITLPGFRSVPRNRWIDVVVHIRFTARPQGLVELWAREAGGRWPRKPLVRLRRIPTLPRCDACGVGPLPLYTELGLYGGGSTTTSPAVVYVDGYRRGTTRAAVLRGFG